MAFAMETQARLLEAHWPAAVLKMPQCREVNSKEQEEPLFRGPRVRVGIHWASEGTVAQRWGLAPVQAPYLFLCLSLPLLDKFGCAEDT